MVEWITHTSDTLWYVSPTFGLAKKTIWDEAEMLPAIMPYWDDPRLVKRNISEGLIEWLPTKGKIYILGADRPDLMRGPNPFGVVLDEFSVMKPEVWDQVIQPIVLANPNAWAWFLSTPHGKNHFWRLYQRGQQDHKDWKSWTLPATRSGVFSQDMLEQARLEMTDAGFRQEMLCEFLEGEGAVFRHVREIATETEQDAIPNHLYVMGVDLAKQVDFTVVVVYDRQTNRQVFQDRWQTLEWPFQRAKIAAIARLYNGAKCIIDATGIGDPITDDLIRAGVACVPVKLTNQSKKEIIEKLVIFIEQRKIALLNNPSTLFEFDNYSYEVTKSGNVTYSAPQGLHDDIVIAHALAVSDLFDLPKGAIVNPNPTRLEQDFANATNGRRPDYQYEREWSEWASDD